MPSRRLEHPTRIEILRQAVIDDEPLDEGAMVPVGRPGLLRVPWSLQGTMVPDRAPWSPSRRHGPNQGLVRGFKGLPYMREHTAGHILRSLRDQIPRLTQAERDTLSIVGLWSEELEEGEGHEEAEDPDPPIGDQPSAEEEEEEDTDRDEDEEDAGEDANEDEDEDRDDEEDDKEEDRDDGEGSGVP
ncbi:hypothetical protein SUGI_0851450 [Cryptomeria japonica]|nr:hypothetical protein SUGI_0851450 [Cryptomeria japonica]